MTSKNLFGLDDWTAYLGDKTLPVRTSSLVRLKHTLANDDSTLASLGHQVLKDPVLALHVTRLAQSRHEAKGSVVTSVDHAIASLGFGAIETLIRELDTMKVHPHSVSERSFFRAIAASHHASVQVADWVSLKQLPYAEEARLAALFYGLVHWMLWLYAPLHKHRFQIGVIEENASPVEMERLVFGCTTQEMGRALADRWKLNELTLQALDHDTSPSLSTIKQLHMRALNDPRLEEEDMRELNHLVQQHYFPVKLANWMTLNVSRSWTGERSLRTFDIIGDYLDQPLAATMSRLHRNCALSAREFHVPGVMMPASELLLLPGGGQLPHRLTDQELKLYAERFPEPAEPQQEELPVEEELPPAPELLNPHIYKQILDRFRRGYELYTKQAHILQGLIQGLNRGLGMERVALCVINTRTATLRTAKAIGVDPAEPLSQLEVDLKQPSIFSRLCEKPALLQIHEANRKQIHNGLSPELRGLLEQNDCLIMSIFIGKQPLALIYADRQGSNAPLEEFHLEHFRILCSAATRALKQLPAHTPS
ncbi:HDOD domain-containing protein [Marinobacterium lutimaris]|uniref:HD-like signal output (HDOD) domain, no enzymatic activity n=1 Tax=Marinobacterium lutimaris TaxID=568106 RepID=A0A1H6DNU1_9GAMM|nr:HDOD domain-containing protein [Marinobacterium lutimaris]SEG86433.1 HD-like signal output (HDOD) domain, no enzymatic activity [Marinobacterium lutimaris]